MKVIIYYYNLKLTYKLYNNAAFLENCSDESFALIIYVLLLITLTFHVVEILFIIIWYYLLVIIFHFTHLWFFCFIFYSFWIFSSFLQLEQWLVHQSKYRSRMMSLKLLVRIGNATFQHYPNLWAATHRHKSLEQGWYPNENGTE